MTSSTSSIKADSLAVGSRPLTPIVELRGRAGREELLDTIETISGALGISPVTAEVLVRRGLNEVEIAKAFFAPTLRQHLPNPATIRNIDCAGKIVMDSVHAGEPISIFCDFDVDGVSAGSQLLLFLKALNAKVGIYTPSRFTEGYGLSEFGVQRIASIGTKLLITVDCGITNNKEILLAKSLGMKVVVIDHHLPHELPCADAIVDPAQGDCPLESAKMCAAGLVWMFLIVLRSEAKRRGIADTQIPDPKLFLDLAALGTVCDMVPLVGVNRLIAFRGIESLQTSERVGVRELIRVAGIPTNKRMNSGHLGFGLGPRINAAGRLGDAMDAIELLTTSDSGRAATLARKIDSLNQQRQHIEASMKEACLRQLAESGDAQQLAGIALFGDSFHCGVIGIVAQRLCEQFHKPTAVMAPGEATINGQQIAVVKGSVRGAGGFHVADALQSLSHLLVTHGGHAEAGGFTILSEHVAEFQTAFALAAARSERKDRNIVVDVESSFGPIDFRLADEFSSLSPFGIGNPSPLVLTHNVVVENASLVGERHIRLRLSDGRHGQNAIVWNGQGNPLLRRGEVVSVVYSPELNSYQGITSVQLNVREVWQDPARGN